ncbi:hypothetical protein EAL2_c19200 [Peptoclostridium acidaminophilum DSM 3953]|uniref:Uncharacterized protein n=1 Tax=Peptoclostridium acidaminophilum DSM 3953 TaxID=1286171 RepID=W8U8L9_PEPAC|nr:hypothetical protein EAL2_c19200 [Peptoclostridium acidaminophilum DSM 3953]
MSKIKFLNIKKITLWALVLLEMRKNLKFFDTFGMGIALYNGMLARQE